MEESTCMIELYTDLATQLIGELHIILIYIYMHVLLKIIKYLYIYCSYVTLKIYKN